MWRLILAGCLVLFACGEEKAGRTRALKDGLAAAEAAAKTAPLTRAAVDTPERLARVLGRRFALHAGQLGGLEQRLEAVYEIRANREPEVRLQETLTLRVDAEGQFDLVQRNRYWSREDEDGEDGRGCRWVGGRFYTARRHGPFTELPIRSAENDACLDSSVEPLVGLMRVVLERLEVSPTGPVRVLGRDALKVVFLQRSDERPAARSIPEAWRTQDSAAIWGPRDALVKTYAVPEQVTGDLVLDTVTGVVLTGRLQANFALRKSNRPATLDVRIGLSAAALQGAIEVPEDARPYTARPRVFVDREKLLGVPAKPKGDQEEAALPGPGDAPPLRLGPDEAALDAEDLPGADPDDEDAPP